MIVSDFILQTRAELQEKAEFWKNAELLIKLRRAYISLQFDLPYFMTSEKVIIKEGKDRCYLEQKAIKDISLEIGGDAFEYSDDENLYKYPDKKLYCFENRELLFANTATRELKGTIRYKYEKEIKSFGCEIEIPLSWYKALRLLFMSEIHEKPTRNSKERNLSEYYLKKYENEVFKLKHGKKARPKNITVNYQKV